MSFARLARLTMAGVAVISLAAAPTRVRRR